MAKLPTTAGAAAFFLLVTPVCSLMYDLVEPQLVPGCSSGCIAWSSLNSTVQSWWSAGAPPADAANHCAQLARAPGLASPSPVLDPKGVGGQGAFCFCNSPTNAEFEYCTSPLGRPEQVNLQLASPDTIVASFVTFEAEPPAELPTAMLQKAPAGTSTTVSGVTHKYVSPSGERVYYMHFIKFAQLEPRTPYTYRLRSGGSESLWSANFSFTSGYPTGETKVAIFGDMGVYSWNNMGNLLQDAAAGEVDAVVHIGDHCYNIGGSDDRRGDGYMQAYQPVLSGTPWIPVVGNHEFYDGDKLRRYLNQTEGTVVANQASKQHPWVLGAASTADTALGSLLSAGNHHAAGVHGATPSGTSRYYSVDLGLIHFVALDLNMYNSVDDCGQVCREQQLVWLQKDLAAANSNRHNVPWIVAMSHFPLYCSNCPAPGTDPGAWWTSEQCEFTGHDQACVDPWTASPPTSPGNDDMVPDLEPLFMKFGVDVYASGHIHDYEYIYPVYNNSAVQKSFESPRAPVHLVTGNGGPPSASRFGKIQDWSHSHSNVYSYTRLVAHNASVMSWVQVSNGGSEVIDKLVVTQPLHGPFPIPPHV